MLRPLEISLRVLEPSELDDWLALLNSASQGCPGFEPLVPLDYRRLQARGYADPCSPLVAAHGTALYGGVSFAAGRSSQRGRLNDLCVRPEVRRHGLGRALVTAALAELRERGIQHVQAQGWPVAAYDALYRSVGLVPARRYRLLAWDLRQAAPSCPLDPAIQVRPAVLADVEQLARVYAPMDLPDSYWSRPPEDMEDLQHLALWAGFDSRLREGDTEQTSLVAVLHDRVVGAVTVWIDRALNHAAGRSDGYLVRGGAAVLPASQPREIGRSLVQAALDHCRAHGLTRTLVWACAPLSGDTPLVDLYRDCGASEQRCLMAWERTWPP